MIDLDRHSPEFACRAIEFLLQEAVERRASDIHFQPRRDHLEVLFRVDGVLTKFGEIPSGLETDPVARLLVLANLPTYQTKKPQEGRLRETPNGIEMRLGTFPTVHGTRAVVRLMNRDDSLITIEQLGLPDDVANNLESLTRCQDGAVLMTGPAGSGKTTTLYACLRKITVTEPRRSIVTIEDPVESILDGVSQSQIGGADTGGMTLASALRSVLRQDPEVLLVGEIRDNETAAAAFGASLTGHLVYSSLHASDVATALRRLVEMQIPAYLIRSGLRAICSQRLLRRLCVNCRLRDTCDWSTLGIVDGYQAKGCDACGGTGYRGRLVVAELFRLDDPSRNVSDVLDLVAAGGHVEEIRNAIGRLPTWASLRMRTLKLVERGETSMNEAYRVLGTEGWQVTVDTGARER